MVSEVVFPIDFNAASERSISSVISTEASILPDPLHDGQSSVVVMSVSGRTLCLVISTTPNLLGVNETYD